MFSNLSLRVSEFGSVMDVSMVYLAALHLCVVLYKNNVLEIHLCSNKLHSGTSGRCSGQSSQTTVLHVDLLAEPGKRSCFAQIIGVSPLLICLLVEDGTILLLDLSMYLVKAKNGDEEAHCFSATGVIKNEDTNILIVPLAETKRHLWTLIDRPENSLCGAPCSLSLCALSSIYPSVLLIPHSDGSLYYIPIVFMWPSEDGQLPAGRSHRYPDKVLMGRYWRKQDGDHGRNNTSNRNGQSMTGGREFSSSSRINANVFDIRGLALCSMALQFSPETKIPLIEVSLILHKRSVGAKKCNNSKQIPCSTTAAVLKQNTVKDDEEEDEGNDEEENVWRDSHIESPSSHTHTSLPSVSVQFCSVMDEDIEVCVSQVPLFPMGASTIGTDNSLVLQGMRFVYMNNSIVPRLVRHSQCVQSEGGRVQSPHPAFQFCKSTIPSKAAKSGENDVNGSDVDTAIALLSTLEDMLRVYLSRSMDSCSAFSVLEISLRELVDVMSGEDEMMRVVQAALLSSQRCVYALTQVNNDTHSTNERQSTSILVCSSSLQILQCIAVGGPVLFSGVSHSMATTGGKNDDDGGDNDDVGGEGIFYLVTNDGLFLIPVSSPFSHQKSKSVLSNIAATAGDSDTNATHLEVPGGSDAKSSDPLGKHVHLFVSQPTLETLQDLFVELCEYQQKMTSDLSIIAPTAFILNTEYEEDGCDENRGGEGKDHKQSLVESCDQLHAVMDHYLCLVNACAEDPSMLAERDEQFHRICMLLVDIATGPLLAANTSPGENSSDDSSNMLLLLDLCRDAHHTALTAYFIWKLTYSPVSALLSCDHYDMVQQSFHAHVVSLRRYLEVQSIQKEQEQQKEESIDAIMISKWLVRLLDKHLERCDLVEYTKENGMTDHNIQVSCARSISAMLLELCLVWAKLAVPVDELQSFLMQLTNTTILLKEAADDKRGANRRKGKGDNGLSESSNHLSQKEQRYRLALKEALIQLPQDMGDELGLSGEFLFVLFT